MDEDCFVSSVKKNVKSNKSVNIALNSQKINGRCIKMRPQLLIMEKSLNQILVEITGPNSATIHIKSRFGLRLQTKEIIRRDKPTLRVCNNRRKIPQIFRIQKWFYGLDDIPTIFQETIDRTLGYSTPGCLDDIIVVARGSKQDHEKII